MIWTRPPFDPARPFGDRYPALNAYPEPLAFVLALPPGHPWWRYLHALERDVPGAKSGTCIQRIDQAVGWEPGNVRVAELPPELAHQRAEERISFVAAVKFREPAFDRMPRGARSTEWKMKVLSKQMKGPPGRPARAYSAFMMWKRLEDWALDIPMSESALRRKLKQGMRLEEIILEEWRRRG